MVPLPKQNVVIVLNEQLVYLSQFGRKDRKFQDQNPDIQNKS